MIKKTMHCCELMDNFLEDIRILLFYSPVYREYFIPLLYKGKTTAIQCLIYCPWCGKKLPEDLRNKYFEILEKEYGLDDPRKKEQEKLVPKEFKTDEWWKKRNL
jgi:uncharacterized protein DUF6980